MAATLQIWRTGGVAYTDYTNYLWDGGGALVEKDHKLNEPQVVTFTLTDGIGGYQTVEAGNRVSISTVPYANWFTGYLINTPEKELLGYDGTNPVYGYRCKAASEEIRLEWQTAVKFPTLPPFASKFQGEIVKELITILGGGLTTTNVDNGIKVPYFRVRPEEGFFDAVRRLSDRTNMKFWTVSGAVWYKAFSDLAFSPAPNEADSQFNPYGLTVNPVQNPVLNDVIAVGSVEPQAYVREYFIGDGYTDSFPLKLTVFGAISSKLLEDDFTGTTIDANRWTKTDPTGLISISSNSLSFNGGPTAANSRLTAKQGIEIGGVIELRAGRVRFGGATNCIVGGAFSTDTGLLADCVAGFRCTPSGGQTQLQAIVNGALVGPTYTTLAGKTYQFILTINCPVQVRQRWAYSSLANSYGGGTTTADASISFAVTELTDSESDKPIRVLSHSATVSGIAQFLWYTAISGPGNGTDLVNLALNFCLLRKPIPADLWTKKTTDSSYVQQRLGDKADPEARASIVTGPEGYVLAFFKGVVPDVRELVKLGYRTAGQARARVRKDASITSEASKAGDSGVRAAILPQVMPGPRNATELEFAIQAFIDDRTSALYDGTWAYSTKAYIPGAEPIPGRKITVSATSRYPQFTALVNEVTSKFLLTTQDNTEVIEHAVSFGPLSSFEQLQREFEPAEDALQGTLDTLIDVPSVEFGSVGTQFAADVPGTGFDGTLTATTVEVDAGQAPSTSFEVRRTDSGWGSDSAINFVKQSTSQVFALPRNSRNVIYWIENRSTVGADASWDSGSFDSLSFGFTGTAGAAATLSRYPSAVRVVYPLIPGAPTATVNITDPLHPIISLSLPGDAQDVWGVEIRDSDNATVLYTYGDILLSVTPNSPALYWTWNNSSAISSKTFYAYTFNLVGEYSGSFVITMDLPSLRAPGVPTSLDSSASGRGVFDFRWAAPSGASKPETLLYELQIASDSGFTANLKTFGVTPELRFTYLLPNAKRYWRVRARYPNAVWGDYATYGSPTVVSSGTAMGYLSDGFTYVSDTSSITWSWTNLKIYWDDQTQTNVGSGSQAITGLSSATTYYFYPYYDFSSGLLQWVAGGVGSPAYAQTAKSAVLKQQVMLDGRIGLSIGAMSGATTSSGGGGGGGGGSGGCLRAGMVIKSEKRGLIPIESVEIGERITSRSGWTTVVQKQIAPAGEFVRVKFGNGEELDVTPSHTFCLPDGSARAAACLSLGDFVVLRKGIGHAVSITRVSEPDLRVMIGCEPDHEFYTGKEIASVLVHNPLEKL